MNETLKKQNDDDINKAIYRSLNFLEFLAILKMW